MRVLVIGATGFIGTRVVDDLVLRHGFGVRVTVRDYRKAIRIGRLPVEWVDGSADDPERLRVAAEGCDAVICSAHPFSAPREEEAALRVCRAAVAAAAATSTRRLVFLSSTAIYGTSGGEVGDDTPPRPDTPYGRIKRRCEVLLAREHDAGTIRLVILRPSIVYGPFSPSWTIRPAKDMLAATVVLPAGATGACNAIHVDDVARVVGEAVRMDTQTMVALNLNAPEHVSWRTFYGAYEACVRPGSVVEWPMDAVRAGLAAARRERSGWSAVKRALRDRAVRDRLNEIPVMAWMNHAGKSLGWGGLPPAAPKAAPEAAPSAGMAGPAGYPPRLPGGLFLDLYLGAPYVDGSTAASRFGLVPRPLASGMVSTLAWLEWAGLA